MRYNYNYSYNSSGNSMAMSRLGDVGILVESIKPNIKDSYASAKAKKNLFLILIPVCMILFMGGGVLMGVTGGFGINVAFLPVMLLGFFGFGACGALTGAFSAKAVKLQVLIGFINEVEAQDKTNLDNLSLSSYIGKNSVILIINKLIQTDNLRNYEVIGNVGVARTELRLKERDFIPVNMESARKPEYTRQRFKCPSCGAAITEKTGKFCMFCGTRLE